MGLDEQEFSTEVHASVAQCFATITDFESYPRWFSTIQQATVLDRHPNRLAKHVEYYIDMKLKTVRYVLEYEYVKPTQLTWKSVDGDIEAIEGRYLFEKLGPTLSRATCRQSVDLGFWLPGPLRSLIERQALKQSVLEFKAAAETAARKKK
ncbi:MAG: type II toxin-antitoxin system RatA family toxin [Candidatus Binatia bacterium]